MALTAFRIGELERKMQAAAAQLDYERAIELRDQVREMRKQLEGDEPPAGPKIVDIFTKTEVSDHRLNPGEPFIDQDAIDALEAMLKEARAGEVNGVCILAGVLSSDGYLVDVKHSVSGICLDYTRLFVGGTQTLAHDLLELEYDSFNEDEYDEE